MQEKCEWSDKSLHIVHLRLNVKAEDEYRGEISYGHHGCKRSQDVWEKKVLGYEYVIEDIKFPENAPEFEYIFPDEFRGKYSWQLHNGNSVSYAEVPMASTSWASKTYQERYEDRVVEEFVVVAQSPKGYYVLGIMHGTCHDWRGNIIPGCYSVETPNSGMCDCMFNACWLVEDILDSAGLLDQDRYIQDC